MTDFKLNCELISQSKANQKAIQRLNAWEAGVKKSFEGAQE